MKIEEYYKTVTDAWRFFRKYLEQMPLSEEAWENEVQEKIAFVESHQKTGRFALHIMTAIENELEHLSRGGGITWHH